MTSSVEHVEGSGGGFQNPFSRELPPPPSTCSTRRENAVSLRNDRRSGDARTDLLGQCAARPLNDSDQRLAEAIADAQHHRPRWQRDAACRGAAVDLYFPARGEPTEPARTICSTCTVIAECRNWALAQRDDHGIAAGLSGRQRRQLRAERKRGAA